MKRKAKGILKFIMFLAVVIIVCLLIQMVPGIAPWIEKTTGWKNVKAGAKTVATVALGAVVVSWGIATLSIPILGASMVVIGLVLIGYAVYPMFVKPSTVSNASYDQSGPLKIFG